jgi:hypothetical protein
MYAAVAFLVLREVAFSGDPTGEAEEALASPESLRLVRKSTAVFNRVF